MKDKEFIMYAKLAAVVLIGVFGIYFSYTIIVLWFALSSDFVTEGRFVITFSLYNIVWLASDIAYNMTRYRRKGSGRFFWMSMLLPQVFVPVILAGVICLFF